jgi:REP element-mobilizing transposase RayT
MSQSLSQIYLHFVFATKHRQPFLADREFRLRTFSYLAGICKNQNCPAIRIGGVEDHVHILCRLAKTMDVATLIREIKRDSSKWVKEQQPQLEHFHWQDGYGAFSLSPGHVDDLTVYIDNQEQHHRKVSFQDELRRSCRLYRVELDERYAWD